MESMTGSLVETSCEITIIRCMCGDAMSHAGEICPKGKLVKLGTVGYWHRNPLKRAAFRIKQQLRKLRPIEE